MQATADFSEFLSCNSFLQKRMQGYEDSTLLLETGSYVAFGGTFDTNDHIFFGFMNLRLGLLRVIGCYGAFESSTIYQNIKSSLF